MMTVDIAAGQVVTIPAIQLTNGKVFVGVVRACDGRSLKIDVHERSGGSLPSHPEEMCVMIWDGGGVRRSCPIQVRAETPRSLVARVVVQERRESPRLRVDMQLAYELVPAAKVKETAESVLARYNPAPPPVSDAMSSMRYQDDGIAQLQKEVAGLRDMLSEVLERIEHLTALVVGDVPDAPQQPLQIQNISSTGVGFICAEPIAAGEYLRLHMVIHCLPRIVIDCMGVIVRCKRLDATETNPGQARYDIGVQFTHIHESDRERLIRYLFQVQRRMLRDRAEARQSVAETA